MFNSLLLSIGFFTIVPLKGKWDENGFKRYPFMLPLVGALIGFIASLVLLIEGAMVLKIILIAISFIVINGGLHFDGLIDCADAYFSQKDFKRKSEIMEDPRTGAFGLLTGLIYFSLLIGVAFEAFPKLTQLTIFMIPIISRSALSAFSTFGRHSQWPGLLPIFTQKQKRITLVYLIIIFSLLSFFMWKLVIVAIAWTIIFELFCKKKFSGISGDACGAFVTILDLILLGAIIWLL